MSAFGQHEQTQREMEALRQRVTELEKELVIAVAEWKKWEKLAGDNWLSYVQRESARRQK